MTERPSAVLLPGGDVVVPGELLAGLLSVLREHADVCRGMSRPSGVSVPRWTPGLAGLLTVVAGAAADHQQRKHRAAAVGTLSVLPPAETRRSCGEAITVREASVVLGLGERRCRQLLAAGVLVGRKAARDCWVVDRSSVAAYRAGRCA